MNIPNHNHILSNIGLVAHLLPKELVMKLTYGNAHNINHTIILSWEPLIQSTCCVCIVIVRRNALES